MRKLTPISMFQLSVKESRRLNQVENGYDVK